MLCQFCLLCFHVLMCHFWLLKSFERIHLSPNHAAILCNILVFCHPAPNIESPLFGCLPQLIKYICSYPPHLETVLSICSLIKCVMLPRGDNFLWFSEAALKFNRKPKTMLCFTYIHTYIWYHSGRSIESVVKSRHETCQRNVQTWTHS